MPIMLFLKVVEHRLDAPVAIGVLVLLVIRLVPMEQTADLLDEVLAFRVII